MSSKNIFELRDITKTYERKIALYSLSLNIKKGEIIALIGPSGAGKTTLLNILANVVKASSGKLLIAEKLSSDYTSRKKFAKKVGIIRQQFDLVDQLPVIHNVLAGRLVQWGFFKSLISLCFPQDKSIAIEALDRVGLLDKRYEQTCNLSGGEQQRVALARLLVQRPEVILADEPVSALDPARAEDILSTLITLVKEENQTLITVLHSTIYAKKYFTRIIALKDGKVYFDLDAGKVTEEDLENLYTFKEMNEGGGN